MRVPKPASPTASGRVLVDREVHRQGAGASTLGCREAWIPVMTEWSWTSPISSLGLCFLGIDCVCMSSWDWDGNG